MLTSTEQRVLEIFRDYTDRKGQPPLLREIGQALGIRTRRAEIYVLKVAGDSMIAADILDGDLVFLRRQETAENGDIVSALIDGEEARPRPPPCV